MDRRFCFLSIALLHILLCLVSATSRPFAAEGVHVVAPHGFNGTVVKAAAELEEEEEMRQMGSRPPSCEHKCYGCMPCEAIQVPTNTGRVGVQYSNYEPEGWKCKCGPSFYSP